MDQVTIPPLGGGGLKRVGMLDNGGGSSVQFRTPTPAVGAAMGQGAVSASASSRACSPRPSLPTVHSLGHQSADHRHPCFVFEALSSPCALTRETAEPEGPQALDSRDSTGSGV